MGTVDRNQDGRINFEEWYELIQNTVEYPLFNSLFEEFRFFFFFFFCGS